MKFACIFLLFASVLVGFSVAETVTGKVYPTLFGFEEVRIKEVKPNGVQIVHKWGGRFVPIDKIPEKIRKELGLSELGAKKFEAKQRLLEHEKRNYRKAASAVDAATVELSGRVLQQVEGGLLLSDAVVRKRRDKKEKRKEYYDTLEGSGPTLLDPNRKKKKVRRSRDVWKWVYDSANVGVCFVECQPTLYEGQKFSQKACKIGSFEYISALGVKKVVPRYSIDMKGQVRKVLGK